MQLVKLKSYIKNDVKGIFQNSTEDGIIGCMPTNSVELFSARLCSLLRGTFFEFFTVSVNDKCEGCIYAYEYKPADMHAKIMLEAKTLSETEKLEAIKRFLAFLFARYPLRKVFYETTDIIFAEDILLRLGFKLEMTVTLSRYISGKYKDMRIYSYYMEDCCDE